MDLIAFHIHDQTITKKLECECQYLVLHAIKTRGEGGGGGKWYVGVAI